MKYLFLAFLLSGCAHVGAVLQGAGNGLQKASKSPDPIHCTTLVDRYSNQQYTTCN